MVCPDLRGYGGSLRPAPSGDHAACKPAGDMPALMGALEFATLSGVGHDRRARVTHRLALDAPERAERLAVLDIVPILEQPGRADMAFAPGYRHWFWFAQPHLRPNSVINAAPDEWFSARTSRDHALRNEEPDLFAPEARAGDLAAAHDPRTVEDDRGTASIDLAHDRASRPGGARVRCPMLVPWGARGRIGGR